MAEDRARADDGRRSSAASACSSTTRARAATRSAAPPHRRTVGPDLTHLQSRTTLAALTIPNRKGYLAGWVLDPQHVKPGNRMPAVPLPNDDFNDLLAYLESLK